MCVCVSAIYSINQYRVGKEGGVCVCVMCVCVCV